MKGPGIPQEDNTPGLGGGQPWAISESESVAPALFQKNNIPRIHYNRQLHITNDSDVVTFMLTSSPQEFKGTCTFPHTNRVHSGPSSPRGATQHSLNSWGIFLYKFSQTWSPRDKFDLFLSMDMFLISTRLHESRQEEYFSDRLCPVWSVS